MAQPIYFTTLSDIKANTLLDDNISDDYMKVMLRICDDNYVQELLGTPLFNALKAGIRAKQLTDMQTTLIQDYILNYIYATMEYIAIDYLLTKFSNSGVNVSTPDSTAQRQYSELLSTRVHKTRSVNSYAGLLKTYVENNIEDFPEYNETDEGVPAKKINNYGFWFDADDDYDDDEYNDRKATNRNSESI